VLLGSYLKFLSQGSDSEKNVMAKVLFVIQMRYLFFMRFFFDVQTVSSQWRN